MRYQVHAIGLNLADLLYLDGEHYVPRRYPSRIGVEACGAVDPVGEGFTAYAVGDRVSAVPYADPNYAVGSPSVRSATSLRSRRTSRPNTLVLSG